MPTSGVIAVPSREVRVFDPDQLSDCRATGVSKFSEDRSGHISHTLGSHALDKDRWYAEMLVGMLN